MTADPLRTLVVDDNAGLRRLIGLKLSIEADLDVVGEAVNGAVALEMAAALKPDVVVLDLSMPVMDGLEALPPLRALLPHAGIVVLSAFDAGSLRDLVQSLGADGYVEKGAPLEDLVELIRQVAGRVTDRVIDLNAHEENVHERP